MLMRSTTEREPIMKTTKSNKATILSAAAVAPAAVIASAAPAAVVVVTKADKARGVFAYCYPDGKTTKMQRKDIIAKLIGEAGLTKAGAGTYLQNMKNKAGITVHRAPAAPAVATA